LYSIEPFFRIDFEIACRRRSFFAHIIHAAWYTVVLCLALVVRYKLGKLRDKYQRTRLIQSIDFSKSGLERYGGGIGR
jgi:hypothetical protein